MQLDWFTTAVQIVNFLILVLLLRHFLYGRILQAIDHRQEQLQAEWDAAQKKVASGELKLVD